MDLSSFDKKIVAQNDLLEAEKNLSLTFTNIIFEKLAKKKEKFLKIIRDDPNKKDNLQVICGYFDELNKIEQKWLKMNEILKDLMSDPFLNSLDDTEKEEPRKDVKLPKKPSNKPMPKLETPKFNSNQWYQDGIPTSIQNKAEGTFYMIFAGPELDEMQKDLNKCLKSHKRIPEVGEILGIKIDGQIMRAMRIPGPKKQMKILLLDSAEEFNCQFKDEEFFQLPDKLKTQPLNVIFCQTNDKDFMEENLNSRVQFKVLQVEQQLDRDFYQLHRVNLKSVNLNKSLETISSGTIKNASKSMEIVSDGSWEELADKDFDVNEYLRNFQKQKPDPLPKVDSKTSLKSSSNPFNNPEILKQIDQDIPEEEPAREFAISREKMTAEEREMFDEEPQNFDDPLKAVLGYHPRDEEKYCRYYDPETGGCYKGGQCTYFHYPELKDGWTRDQMKIFSNVQHEQVIPPENTMILIKMTVLESPNVFYAQIHRTKKKCASFSFEVMTLTDLINHLNLPNEIKLMESFDTVPGYGELVIAPYLDGKYYRGKFLDNIDDFCTIFYVDYGDTGQVKLKNLRKFNSKFSYLPFQAVKFQLANCVPKSSNEQEAKTTLSDICSNKVLKAKIVNSSHECVFVHLFDEQGYNVGETLLKLGIVERRMDSLPTYSLENIPG